MLPIDQNFEKEDSTEMNQKLIIHDMEIENPFSESHIVMNNFIDSPPFGLYPTVRHLQLSDLPFN